MLGFGSDAVTRSHKQNDRDHAGLADGTAAIEEHLPRYFAKAGHVDADPKKTKKDGGGKANWGREGAELEDYAYNMHNARRRSNSSTHAHGLKDFKTKFETVEQEPVFEEELHGPLPPDENELEKSSTMSSDHTASSIDEEDMAHDKKE
ncbi:hypothetical protein K490DRAFT_74674 [Saccharata proteae CBS 121410]|uniref:STF2-like protein n=1 Tax=Saccharata proteae CBS 121410 TaxID=1314787 RepID=A0A9P4HQN8_9PEZI|nr:hypothetical protein K490DRAFT_74674 [Saccharata proteae CBS 121410]